MKVNIYETVEISNEQRVELARRIDGDGAKKRQATRDEIKEFVWTHGAAWLVALEGAEENAEAEEETSIDDELANLI